MLSKFQGLTDWYSSKGWIKQTRFQIKITTDLIIRHERESRTTKVSFKSSYTWVYPPWTWTAFSFCSTLLYLLFSLGILVQKGTSPSLVLNIPLLTRQGTINAFSKCIWPWSERVCLFLHVNAKLQEVTIATPTGCCSGQLCTEVQKSHSLTSGLCCAPWILVGTSWL